MTLNCPYCKNSNYCDCLFSPLRAEALGDAHPTGVPPPAAQYQSPAEGRYQHMVAPPTTGDPLITSCTTRPG